MTKRVLLLLADGFEQLEAAGFIDVLGWANIDGDTPIALVSAGLQTPVKTTFGYSVNPDALLADLELHQFDALALPGGFAGAGYYAQAYGPDFASVIQHFAKKTQPIASVCVASLAVAKAGVLNGKKATTYHQIGGQRKAELEDFGAVFVDEAIVTDNGIISSTGPGTGVEVAFELLELLTSFQNAERVRALMRMPPRSDTWRSTPQVTV